MKEMNRLLSMLFPEEGSKLVDLKFFPGEQSVTVEDFCKEVHSAFLQVDSGQVSSEVWPKDRANRVKLDRFLAVP
jgi:uncharacterized protein YkuJ